MAQKGKTRRINLALQGGGAHGAYTWGVLDRLLEDETIEIAGISGTSAGALNGAAVKAGLSHAKGEAGRKAAQENLAWLWAQISEVPNLRFDHWTDMMMPYLPAPMRRWVEVTSPMGWMDMMARLFSPYDLGPWWENPLKPLIERLPFAEICSDCEPRFFVSATNVRSGKIRIFTTDEITVDALLASACLPTMFRAVEIEDAATGRMEAYWDGGYSGNPALFPLFEAGLPRDIMIVGINPLYREAIPKDPNAIENRINEISFNASLLGEMRAIQFVRRLIADGRLGEGSMKDVLLHMITDDDLMNSLLVESKLLPGPGMVQRLFEAGKASADQWLAEHGDKIGHEASVELPTLLE